MSWLINLIRRPLLATLLLLVVPSEAMALSSYTVRAAFENRIAVPPASNLHGATSSYAVFFGGTNRSTPVPGLAGVQIGSSSFGQPFAAQIPYRDFIDATLTRARERLYYDQAPPEHRDQAAFRYRALLYDQEAVDAETFIRAQFDTIGDFWGASERDRALAAADEIVAAIRYAPWDRNLRNALLDVYYDIAVAEKTLAQNRRVSVAEIMLELEPVAPGEFLIDREVEALEQAQDLYRNALTGYMSALQMTFGVDVGDFDAAYLDEPFGYYLFRREVPLRSPMAALFHDSDGNWVLPLDAGPDDVQEPLFQGYKDVTLLFELQRDYLRTAVELSKRYVMRGLPATNDQPSDSEKARALIGDTIRASYIEGSSLLALFPEIEELAGPVDPASGLREAVASWRYSFTELGRIRRWLEGTTNILGFVDDFLVLVQSVMPGDPQSQFFDSYDFFANYINNSSANGPLARSLTDFANAQADYANYRDRNDQLALQFADRTEQYNARLREIVGVNPGEPGYETPAENPGGLISQQVNNIDIARLRIERNRQEVANLEERIRIEIWRRGQEAGINNAIESVYIDYGDQQARLTEEIGKINGDQAFANNIASAIASVSYGFGFSIGGGTVSYAINAGLQRDYERRKAKKQASKERLAARERAQIQSLQDDLLDVNSRAQIKTWLLQMSTLALESQEAAIGLQQEVERLTALASEKQDLERRARESDELLAGRYFADPSHRLLKEASVLRSEFSFNNAQRWLYLAIRAAEYKWNQDFVHTAASGVTYTRETLFRLRNARELNELFQALSDWNTTISIGARNDDAYKKFSVRDDFLGYRAGNEYFDPVTGELVSPFAAFRSFLSQDRLYLEPDDPENPIPGFRVLRLNFSTAFVPDSGGLFLRNRWLEKIQFLRVKLYGGAVGGINSTVDGYLSYGGLSQIRTQMSGTSDPDNVDRLLGETRDYSTRYWFYQNGEWRSREAFGSNISVQVSNDPDVPPQVYQINSFQEYSVAATNWELYVAVESSGGVPLVDVDSLTDIEFHLYFYWYARN